MAFWSCIKEGKPQKEDPTQRKGQSLRSILGNAYKVIIKRDEDVILEIEDVKVEKKVRGVRVYLANKYGCNIEITNVSEFTILWSAKFFNIIFIFKSLNGGSKKTMSNL